ncbi:MAG: hypothetical protein IJ190_08330 [Prevotella sp.]|nr:hypothetical protein [Prevotella sp.]
MRRLLLSMFALLALGGKVFAGDKPVIAVADVDALPGETVWASVNLLDGKADTYTAMTLYVQVPMDLVSYIEDVGCSVSETWEGTSFSSGMNPSTGVITVPFASANAIPGSSLDDLVKVKIVLKEDTPLGEYTLTLKQTMFEYNLSDKDYADDVTFQVKVVNAHSVLLDETSTTAPVPASGVNVTVKRTIKANEWSTICLPFAMSAEQVKTAFGDDVELKDFIGYETTEEGGEIVGIKVNFSAATAIESNHPYIIKVSSAVSEFSVNGVDIAPEEEPTKAAVTRTKKQWSEMIGTYQANTTVPDACLFLSGNEFYYSNGSTKMKAFRAYFDFYDELDDKSAASRAIGFGDDTTGILSINLRNSNGEVYYDLNGRRVEKPAKGVYIINGKKVIMK